MSTPEKEDACVICGTYGPITRDHIPPQKCFPKPRPSDLITVPACLECNGGRSDLDDKFQVFLGAIARGGSQEGDNLWEERKKRLDENRKFKREFLDGLFFSGGRPKTKIDLVQFSPIYDNIFRGLYFKHFGSIYPPEKEFEMHIEQKITPETAGLAQRLFKGKVGSDQFLHGINATDEDSTVVAGLLIFYNCFSVIGLGGMPDHPERIG